MPDSRTVLVTTLFNTLFLISRDVPNLFSFKGEVLPFPCPFNVLHRNTGEYTVKRTRLSLSLQ